MELENIGVKTSAKLLLFFGAQSLALGMCTAIQKLYPEYKVEGFLVTTLSGNPSVLYELPVYEIASYAQRLSMEERLARHVLVATPEDFHSEIADELEYYGFKNFTCMDSVKEKMLMQNYFSHIEKFPVLHNLSMNSTNTNVVLQVIQAKFGKDKALKSHYKIPKWIKPLQVGAALTDKRVVHLTDEQGDNISLKNVNYCELTGLYWLWKNGLVDENTYYGLCHYRRIPDVEEDDLRRLKVNDVDAILSFPTIHEPDINSHHRRYVKDLDWQAMLQALQELQPAYYEVLDDIFSKPYFYNYNMIIAKKQVLADYCAWLFPILERAEELSEPKGWERADRYIGYLGENLMTLYFMYHQKDLNIVHTGRIMLT